MTDILEKLKAPFPREAHTVDSSRGFDLTSIKAQYVVERLNDVFSPWGWFFEPKFESTDQGVLCNGELVVSNEESVRRVHAYGFSQHKKNMGDSYKSAATDSLGKAASWLCIGNDVFKGNVTPPKTGDKTKQSNDKPRPASLKQVMLIEKMVKTGVIKDDPGLDDLTAAQASELITKHKNW